MTAVETKAGASAAAPVADGIDRRAWQDAALLTTAEMGRSDRAAIARGISGYALMQAAGHAVMRVTLERFAPRPTLVLCGPGNNGGDGYVAARLLRDRGWPVTVAALGDPGRLQGDAALARDAWNGPIAPLSPDLTAGAGLLLDALFGAGLTRDVDGVPAAVLRAAGTAGIPSVAVDVPSGLDGNTGQVRGCCLPAAATATFFRFKPGHLLLPGRALCGDLHLADIGIPAEVLREIAPAAACNGPALWRDAFPRPQAQGHKFSRGHLLVRAGAATATGAARLAAEAALRCAAGVVTVAAAPDAARVAATQLTAVMVAEVEDGMAFDRLLEDERRNCVLLGPGNGVGAATRGAVLAALHRRKACLLDADAVTSFADRPEDLFEALHADCVLTPHEGEFRRLFPDLGAGSKLDRARAAAARSGAVLLLKGADTVIAAPDGRAAINANAPPVLATAGAGDVLAGTVAGLLTAGMPAFAAAACGVWLQGAAATAAGPGATAEDFVAALRTALRAF